jgi:hypothetical protein
MICAWLERTGRDGTVRGTARWVPFGAEPAARFHADPVSRVADIGGEWMAAGLSLAFTERIHFANQIFGTAEQIPTFSTG